MHLLSHTNISARYPDTSARTPCTYALHARTHDMVRGRPPGSVISLSLAALNVTQISEGVRRETRAAMCGRVPRVSRTVRRVGKTCAGPHAPASAINNTAATRCCATTSPCCAQARRCCAVSQALPVYLGCVPNVEEGPVRDTQGE